MLLSQIFSGNESTLMLSRSSSLTELAKITFGTHILIFTKDLISTTDVKLIMLLQKNHDENLSDWNFVDLTSKAAVISYSKEERINILS